MIIAKLREDWEQALRDMPVAFQSQYYRDLKLVLMGEEVYSYYYVKLFQLMEELRHLGLTRDSAEDDDCESAIVKALHTEDYFEYQGVTYVMCKDLHPMQIARI